MLQSNIGDIAGRLRGISRDGGSIEAAQVKIIGLDEIREAAGDRWPRMRERVRNGSLSILQQHMTADDVAIPAGDGFLVILAESIPGRTQQRCQAMRDALLKFYLGEEALSSLRPQVQNRSLSADGLSDLLASTLPASGARMVARAHDDEIAEVKIYLAHERNCGPRLIAPVTHMHGEHRIAYNPDFILDGRHHTRRDHLELDIAVLDAALVRAKLAQAAGQSLNIAVSVHASTLQIRRSRETYLGWLAEIDSETRRSFLIAVAEIEKGTPMIAMAEWCSNLRSSVARVWLDFHYTDHAITSIGATGATGAGFHLPIYPGAQKEPRAERMRDQIRFWRKTLHSQNMRLIVHGFREESFVQDATGMGVDLLTSDALWPFAFPARESQAH